jgi:DNA-directed RNA polymerase subunit N (RpoN/RPB10)
MHTEFDAIYCNLMQIKKMNLHMIIIMYPYILCVCGRSSGDLYDAYKAMREELHQQAFEDYGDIDPMFVPVCDDIEVKTGPILDALGLELVCCRTHMMTQVEFKDLY